jgi:hypothetical protein
MLMYPWDAKILIASRMRSIVVDHDGKLLTSMLAMKKAIKASKAHDV